MSRSRLLSLFVLSVAATTTARADYAYIGYYHSQTVAQLNVGSGSNTTISGATTMASGYAPEAISSLVNMPGPNSSQLLIVDVNDGSVKSYNAANGNLISNNFLKDASGNTLTLGSGGLAGATLSADGRDYYVAMSSGTASNGGTSGIYEFDTVTGKQVGYAAFNNVHDVTFHNGYVYATAYQSTTQTGVYQLNADLTGMTQVVAAKGAVGATPTSGSTNDLYNATGMAFVGNNLYVGNASINGGASGQSFIQEYALTYGTKTTSSYITTITSSTAIINPFGLTAGPDNNIYVSSLGTIGNHDGQITQINSSTNAVSTYLANGAFGGQAGDAPKYLTFASQSTAFTVPEPGSIALTSLGLAGFAVIGRIRKQNDATVS